MGVKLTTGWALPAALGVALALLTAGCTTPAGPRTPTASQPTLPDPATLPVPEWRLGEPWDFSNGEGSWVNYTVQALESKADEDAYRVLKRREYSVPGTFARQEHTEWYATADLAPIGFRYHFIDSESYCASPRLLPLANRTFTCTEADGRYPSATTIRVMGWERVQGVETVHFNLTTEGNLPVDVWYDPNVGFWQRFTEPEAVGGPLDFHLVRHVRPQPTSSTLADAMG